MDGSLPPKLSKISALILLDKCIHPLFGFPGSTSISGRARTETRLTVAPHGEEDAGRAFGSRNAGTGFLLLPVLATRKAHFWAADAFNKCGINRSVISQLKGEAECGAVSGAAVEETRQPHGAPQKQGHGGRGPAALPGACPSRTQALHCFHSQVHVPRKGRKGSTAWSRVLGQHSSLVYVFNSLGFAPKARKS